MKKKIMDEVTIYEEINVHKGISDHHFTTM